MEKDTMIDDETLAICVAYEQGYGHGLQNRTELTNPYCKNETQAFMAWNYGFQEGRNKHLKWEA